MPRPRTPRANLLIRRRRRASGLRFPAGSKNIVRKRFSFSSLFLFPVRRVRSGRPPTNFPNSPGLFFLWKIPPPLRFPPVCRAEQFARFLRFANDPYRDRRAVRFRSGIICLPSRKQQVSTTGQANFPAGTHNPRPWLGRFSCWKNMPALFDSPTRAKQFARLCSLRDDPTEKERVRFRSGIICLPSQTNFHDPGSAVFPAGKTCLRLSIPRREQSSLCLCSSLRGDRTRI